MLLCGLSGWWFFLGFSRTSCLSGNMDLRRVAENIVHRRGYCICVQACDKQLEPTRRTDHEPASAEVARSSRHQFDHPHALRLGCDFGAHDLAGRLPADADERFLRVRLEDGNARYRTDLVRRDGRSAAADLPGGARPARHW